MNKCGIIYKITNQINGKIYIGQTTSTLKKRWISHISEVKAKKRTTHFYNALNKYGFENFTIEEICSCSDLFELDRMERYFIKHYDSMSPNGYNLTTGGESGNKQTESTLRKKSISQKEAYQNDPTLKERRTAGLKEFWKNPDPIKLEERSNKIKESITPERREQISQFHKGNQYNIGNTNRRKSVIATNILTHETKEYESMTELAKALSVDLSLVSMAINGIQRHKLVKKHVVSLKGDINHYDKVLIAQTKKSLMRPSWSTKVKCIYVESKQERVFNSAKEAAKELNLLGSEISTRLSGKRKGLHKGYRILPAI